MNTVLSNLQDRGLIERTPHPWHKNILETTLTEQGTALMREADVRAIRVERALAEEFTAAERATLQDLLTRCADRLDSIRLDPAS
jgi:DNA-binding MarR family transcriptional regulator